MHICWGLVIRKILKLWLFQASNSWFTIFSCTVSEQAAFKTMWNFGAKWLDEYRQNLFYRMDISFSKLMPLLETLNNLCFKLFPKGLNSDQKPTLFATGLMAISTKFLGIYLTRLICCSKNEQMIYLKITVPKLWGSV